MSTLISRAISGSKWTSVSQVILLGTALVQTAILSRLLLPADFGIVAIAGVVIGFLAIYSELGMSAAIIQKQGIADDVLSSLYVLNLAAALVCSMITLAVAPLLANWYGQPELQKLIACLSPAFILSAIGSQFRALNQKHLRFELMAKIEVAGALVSLLVAVLSALEGFGAYSLVFATLANSASTSLFNFVTGLRYHRPSLVFSTKKTGEFLRFGLFQMGDNTLNYLNSTIDVLLVGKLTGTHELGLYSISKSLTMRPAGLINPIFNRVAFPVMSHSQDDQAALRNMFLSGLRLLCFINFPIYAFMFVAAEPLVRILLGEPWLQAAPVLQIMALYFLIRSTGNPVGSLLMATASYRRSFVWNLALFAIVPFTIWIGAQQGITGVAWALVFLQLALVIPNWFFLVKPTCNVGFADYFGVQTPSLLAAAGAALAAWSAMNFLSSPWLDLLAAVGVGAVTYLAISMAIHDKAIKSARAIL